MSSTFIPAGGVVPDGPEIDVGSWWPALSPAECRRWTGLGDMWPPERVRAALMIAASDVLTVLDNWRANLTVAALADVPCPLVDGQPAAVVWFKTAVYCRVRASFCEKARDFDSTRSGHARADALEQTADSWERQANEALSRLMGRGRTVVELI